MKGSSILKTLGMLGICILPGGSVAAAIIYKYREPIERKYDEWVRTYNKNKGKKCKQCKKDAKEGLFDSFFCPDCNIWTSGHCKDEKCAICTGRPPKPYGTTIKGKVVGLVDPIEFDDGWEVRDDLTSEDGITFHADKKGAKLGDSLVIRTHYKYDPPIHTRNDYSI